MNKVDYYNKVMNAYNEDSKLNCDVWIGTGEDSHGEHYMIFEDWNGYEKFIQLAIAVLELDEDTKDYQIEQLLETNLVFSDEYTTCDDCGRVVRTSPDSYHWQPSFYVGDGYVVCEKCFNSNENYQEDYLQDKINDPKNAINGLISEEDLEELGFERINSDSFESGWHEGQNDNPSVIFDEVKDRYEEIVFMIDSVSQFDLRFSVWGRGEI